MKSREDDSAFAPPPTPNRPTEDYIDVVPEDTATTKRLTLSKAPQVDEKRTKDWISISVLIFSATVLAILTFPFRVNTSLAFVPLVGLVMLFLLWPVYSKFQDLLRFSAEFEPKKVAIRASSVKEDEVVFLQGELARKKLKLQIAKIEHQQKALEEEKTSRSIVAPVNTPHETPDYEPTRLFLPHSVEQTDPPRTTRTAEGRSP